MWALVVGFLIGLTAGELVIFIFLWILDSHKISNVSNIANVARIENDDELSNETFDFSYEMCPICGHVSLATRYPKRTNTYESPKCEKCNMCGYHAHTWYGEETRVLERGWNWGQSI